MQDLIHQRCANHEFREAVARCPECLRSFCRECVTEHEGRVLCAGCLRKQLESSSIDRRRFSWIRTLAYGSIGVIITWLVFFYLGRILLSIPASFHEGTIWQQGWWQ